MWVSAGLAIDSVLMQVKYASGLKDRADGDDTGEPMEDHYVPQIMGSTPLSVVGGL